MAPHLTQFAMHVIPAQAGIQCDGNTAPYVFEPGTRLAVPRLHWSLAARMRGGRDGAQGQSVTTRAIGLK